MHPWLQAPCLLLPRTPDDDSEGSPAVYEVEKSGARHRRQGIAIRLVIALVRSQLPVKRCSSFDCFPTESGLMDICQSGTRKPDLPTERPAGALARASVGVVSYAQEVSECLKSRWISFAMVCSCPCSRLWSYWSSFFERSLLASRCSRERSWSHISPRFVLNLCCFVHCLQELSSIASARGHGRIFLTT